MLLKLIKKYNDSPRLVRAALWFVLCAFMQKGISVLTTPIFTRLMNTAEYGQYSVFNSWYGIAQIFVSLNLSQGVYTQGIVKFSEDRKKFSSSFQGLNFTLLLLWTGIYLIFRDFFNRLVGLTTVQMLCMLTMIWTTSAFEFWAVEKRTNVEYKALVAVTIFTSLLKPLVGIILVVYAEDKVTARIVGLMLVEVIAYSGLFILQLLRGKQFFSKKYWLYALSFNIPLLPHYFSQIVLDSSDRIMISNIVSSSAAGIYSLAYSVSMVMRLLNGALNQTIMPWVYKRIKADEIKAIAPVSMIALSIVAIGNLMLIAFAPEAIAIFAPAEYHEAIWVVPPVAMSVFFLYMYNYFSCFEFYFEEKKIIGLASIATAVLNVALNAIFIPIFGYVAAAYTTLICNMLYTLGHYLFMRIVIRKHLKNAKVYSTRDIALISAAVLAAGFVLMLLYPYNVIRYVVIAVVLIAGIGTFGLWKKKLSAVFSLLKES